MKMLHNRFKNLTGIQLTLLIAGILWLKTVIVSFIGFNLSIQSLFDVALILTSSIGALLLVMGISFYFGGKVKPAILFALSVVGTGVLYGDLLYYRFYNDFVTAPILFQFDNVGGLSASTVELMSFWDILLFVDLFVLGWFLMKQRFELTIHKETRKKYVAVGAAFLVLTIGLGLVKSVHLFSESYDREQVVKSLGPLNYHVYDLVVGISAPLQRLTMTEAEAVASIESLQQKEPGRTDLYGMAEGKNIVLISLESTQDFVINQKVNGENVRCGIHDRHEPVSAGERVGVCQKAGKHLL